MRLAIAIALFLSVMDQSMAFQPIMVSRTRAFRRATAARMSSNNYLSNLSNTRAEPTENSPPPYSPPPNSFVAPPPPGAPVAAANAGPPPFPQQQQQQLQQQPVVPPASTAANAAGPPPFPQQQQQPLPQQQVAAAPVATANAAGPPQFPQQQQLQQQPFTAAPVAAANAAGPPPFPQQQQQQQPIGTAPVAAANAAGPPPFPQQQPPPQQQQQQPQPVAVQDPSVVRFHHAPFSDFALDKLTPKGPRKNPDFGQPHDSTRLLAKVGSASAGSWWCSDGGWPSPTPRATTEFFFVFHGHGCVTDTDGTEHEFKKHDAVILPKGWSGRWDIVEPIHKVWVVHDHADLPPSPTGEPIRAIVTPSTDLEPEHQQGILPEALHGEPSTASHIVYNNGPTKVGCWTCTPGSFPVESLEHTEYFHVFEGVFFLTNSDGSARRCVAGDTIVLPKGWSGFWDVIETVWKVWVVVD